MSGSPLLIATRSPFVPAPISKPTMPDTLLWELEQLLAHGSTKELGDWVLQHQDEILCAEKQLAELVSALGWLSHFNSTDNLSDAEKRVLNSVLSYARSLGWVADV